jgi:hypothetical protein
MRSRLREDSNFIEICELLEGDDPKLRAIPLVQKDRFTGFFEELAIMRNSGLMTDELALYMFGYYAILCDKSKNYWHGLNKKQALWSLFFDFASDMERQQKSYLYDRTRLNLGFSQPSCHRGPFDSPSFRLERILLERKGEALTFMTHSRPQIR